MKWAMILFGILANATGSSLVKTIPHGGTAGIVGLLTNWRLIVSLGCYGLAFLAYSAAVQKLPLNVAHPVSTAGAIILVGLVSAFVFHEEFGRAQLIGYGLLLAGIVTLAGAAQGAAR